jgi:nitrate reductase NapE component
LRQQSRRTRKQLSSEKKLSELVHYASLAAFVLPVLSVCFSAALLVGRTSGIGASFQNVVGLADFATASILGLVVILTLWPVALLGLQFATLVEKPARWYEILLVISVALFAISTVVESAGLTFKLFDVMEVRVWGPLYLTTFQVTQYFLVFGLVAAVLSLIVTNAYLPRVRTRTQRLPVPLLWISMPALFASAGLGDLLAKSAVQAPDNVELPPELSKQLPECLSRGHILYRGEISLVLGCRRAPNVHLVVHNPENISLRTRNGDSTFFAPAVTSR